MLLIIVVLQVIKLWISFILFRNSPLTSSRTTLKFFSHAETNWFWAQICSVGCLTTRSTKIPKHWIWKTFSYVPFCDLNSTHFLILHKWGLKFYPYGEEGLFRPYVSEVPAAVSSTQDFAHGCVKKGIKVWKRGKSTDMHKFFSSSPCITGYIWNYSYDGKK